MTAGLESIPNATRVSSRLLLLVLCWIFATTTEIDLYPNSYWFLLALIRFSKAISIFFTRIVVPINSVYCAAVMYFRSWASRTRYSVSLADPTAIWRKRAKSAALSLPLPSAILVGMDAQARRIWLVNPYISSRGTRMLIHIHLMLMREIFSTLLSFWNSAIYAPF